MIMYLVYHRLYTTPESSKPAPEFEEFTATVNQRLTNQETLLMRIAQELGLDKPKQQ